MDKDDEAPADRRTGPVPVAEPDRAAGRPAKNGAVPTDGPEGGPGASLAEPDASDAEPRGEAALEAFVSGAAYAALALLGGTVGLLGAFSQDWSAGPVPVAAILLAAAVFLMVRLAGAGMGTRLGGLVPAVVWGVVTFGLSAQRPEGDLVVPGTTAGYVYIVGGLLAAVIAVSLVPSARPPGDWLTGGAARDPRP